MVMKIFIVLSEVELEEKQCVPFLALFVLCGWLFFQLAPNVVVYGLLRVSSN
jgi:hypothetical protein